MERETGILLLAALAVAAGLLFLLVRLFGNPEATAPQGSGFTDVPLPDRRIRLLVSGLSNDELMKILGHFRGLYDVEVDIGHLAGPVFQAAFPQGISPTVLAFLVNFLCYPDEECGPVPANAAVLARLSLCPECGIPDARLQGKFASLYVPEGDTEFDLVHLRLDSGEAFRVPFTDLRWHPTGQARWPAKLDDLARLAG